MSWSMSSPRGSITFDSATVLSRGRVVGQGSADATLTEDALTRAYGVRVSIATAGGRRVFWAEG